MQRVLRRLKLQVLAVQEHWRLAGQAMPGCEGYIWLGWPAAPSSARGRARGGVGFLVCRELAECCVLMPVRGEARHCWLKVQRGAGERALFVGNFYGQVETSDCMQSVEVAEVWRQLEAQVRWCAQHGDWLLLGDFNAWTGRKLGARGVGEVRTNGRRLISLVREAGGLALNVQPWCEGLQVTCGGRGASSQGTVIDYNIAGPGEAGVWRRCVVEGEELMTDHNLVWAEAEREGVAVGAEQGGRRKQSDWRWCVRQADWPAFEERLAAEGAEAVWRDGEEAAQRDRQVVVDEEQVRGSLERAARGVVRQSRQGEGVKARRGWWSKELGELVKWKNRLHKKWKEAMGVESRGEEAATGR